MASAPGPSAVPLLPLPASRLCAPEGSTFIILLFQAEATYALPQASDATPKTLENMPFAVSVDVAPPGVTARIFPAPCSATSSAPPRAFQATYLG